MHDTETLNTLLAKAASEWTEEDRTSIINAMRDQRAAWSEEQALGSRKRITAKKTAAPRVKKDLAFEGLKL